MRPSKEAGAFERQFGHRRPPVFLAVTALTTSRAVPYACNLCAKF